MSDSDLETEVGEEPKDPPEEQEEVEGEPKKEPDEPMMPVAAHVAERKELQKRVEFAEDVARRSAVPQDAQVELVDFLAEPEKIAGFIDQRVRQGLQDISKEFAVDAHGREAVDNAHAALKAHGTPAEQQALAASANPWGAVVKWHQNREALSEIGGDPAAFVARIKKEALAQAAVSKAKGLDPAPTLADEPNLGAREKTDVDPEDSESLKNLLGG